MKRLTGSKDYVCTSGRPTDITTFLNKIGRLYDFTVLSMCVNEHGNVFVIVERSVRSNALSERFEAVSTTED